MTDQDILAIPYFVICGVFVAAFAFWLWDNIDGFRL
jgi:hypothetical protein